MASNPFRQPVSIWQMEFICPAMAVPALESAFEDVSLSVSSFELEDMEDESDDVGTPRSPEGEPQSEGERSGVEKFPEAAGSEHSNASPLVAEGVRPIAKDSNPKRGQTNKKIKEEQDWMRERTTITPDIAPADAAVWRVQILVEHVPTEQEITTRLDLLREVMQAEISYPGITEMQPHDWVSEVQSQFPPLHVARYFVHGSHVEDVPPVSIIPLKVNAGAAFGSGEHATTTGCLRALDMLARSHSFTNMLDMGTGTAILALAMAKTWRTGKVLAVDIDPVSVKVARANILDNRERQRIHAMAGDGYAAWEVKRSGPYDLIVANILAKPLVKFAPLLASHLAPGGMVILSGLLAHQEKRVMAAHHTQGLRLIRRIPINGWHTLMLQG